MLGNTTEGYLNFRKPGRPFLMDYKANISMFIRCDDMKQDVVILGLIFVVFGFALYWIAVAQTDSIPRVGVVVNITPRNYVQVEKVTLGYDVSTNPNKIILDSELVINESKPVSIYALFPSRTDVTFSQVYGIRTQNSTQIVQIPEIKASLLNFTLHPTLIEPTNPTNVRARVELAAENLVSIRGFAKHTVLVTFYDRGEVPWELYSRYFTGNIRDERYTNFEFYVQFPSNSFLMQETFPPPITYGVESDSRWGIWRFNFSEPTIYKTSVAASFASTSEITQKDLLIFLSGAFFATGLAIIVEPSIKLVQSWKRPSVKGALRKKILS